jgi:hypothetical protein
MSQSNSRMRYSIECFVRLPNKWILAYDVKATSAVVTNTSSAYSP